MPPVSVSRRSVAKGLAWTAPGLVVAASAPAFAASPNYGAKAGGVCYVYSGAGSANVQVHDIHLYVPFTTAGTPGPWYYYSITIQSGTGNPPDQPNLLGSGYEMRNAKWTCSGTTCTYVFEVRNLATSGGNCSFVLNWSSDGASGDKAMPVKSTITITTNGTDGSSGVLKYNIGLRNQTSDCANGFKVLTVTGTMASYPGPGPKYAGCPEYQVGSNSANNHTMTLLNGTCVTLAVGSAGSGGYDMCTGTQSW